MLHPNSDIQPRGTFNESSRLIEAPADRLLQALPAAVVLLDLAGKIVFANSSAQRLLNGATAGSDLTSSVMPADRKTFEGYLQSVRGIVDDGASRYTACSLFREGSQPVQVSVTGAPIRHGGQVGLLLNLADVTLQQEREAALESMAMTDALTGLPNRRSFLKSLRAAIEAGHGCVVALADIDRFKQVNDAFGHTTRFHPWRSGCQVGRIPPRRCGGCQAGWR